MASTGKKKLAEMGAAKAAKAAQDKGKAKEKAPKKAPGISQLIAELVAEGKITKNQARDIRNMPRDKLAALVEKKIKEADNTEKLVFDIGNKIFELEAKAAAKDKERMKALEAMMLEEPNDGDKILKDGKEDLEILQGNAAQQEMNALELLFLNEAKAGNQIGEHQQGGDLLEKDVQKEEKVGLSEMLKAINASVLPPKAVATTSNRSCLKSEVTSGTPKLGSILATTDLSVQQMMSTTNRQPVLFGAFLPPQKVGIKTPTGFLSQEELKKKRSGNNREGVSPTWQQEKPRKKTRIC